MIELKTTEEGIRFRVKVVPGSSRSRIAGEMDGALKLAVSAPAEKGRANEAVLDLLAEALGVRAARLHLEAGTSSPYKRCVVSGMRIEQVREALEGATGGGDKKRATPGSGRR